MAANDTQVGGDHYKKLGIQPWDYIAENDLGWFEGSVVKYVTRWRSKDGVADLHKAKHILDKLIEIEERKERLAHLESLDQQERDRLAEHTGMGHAPPEVPTLYDAVRKATFPV